MKMRLLLVASQAKPPRKCIHQINTMIAPAVASACATNVEGSALIAKAISALYLREQRRPDERISIYLFVILGGWLCVLTRNSTRPLDKDLLYCWIFATWVILVRLMIVSVTAKLNSFLIMFGATLNYDKLSGASFIFTVETSNISPWPCIKSLLFLNF